MHTCTNFITTITYPLFIPLKTSLQSLRKRPDSVLSGLYADLDRFRVAKESMVFFFGGDGDFRNEIQNLLKLSTTVVVFYPEGSLGQHLKSLRMSE